MKNIKRLLGRDSDENERIVKAAGDGPGGAVDRATIRILTKPEHYGDTSFGPVIVVHQSMPGSLLDPGNYAHAFGPFATIGEAIEDIKATTAISGDQCFKIVMGFIPEDERGLRVISVEELIAMTGDQITAPRLDLGFTVTDPEEWKAAWEKVPPPAINVMPPAEAPRERCQHLEDDATACLRLREDLIHLPESQCPNRGASSCRRHHAFVRPT